ncbi:MAG: DNA repair protein RecO [Chitinophagaceae bacterium]
MTHKTKGIVLRTIKYGETSIITTVYTELFGVQTYIVKGVRKSSNKSQNKSTFFQPATLLDLIVYHNDLKNLQFIKEFQWSYLYKNIFFDVIKNAVSMYIIELLQHSLKQPEANPELFYFIENSLKQLDVFSDKFTANLSLYFILHLAAELGFKIRGEFSKTSPVLDLQEGKFVSEIPIHPYYLSEEPAKLTSRINSIQFYNELESIQLNKFVRRELLRAYQQYLTLHINDIGEMKSLQILQELLS